jgi:hypothetical protein
MDAHSRDLLRFPLALQQTTRRRERRVVSRTTLSPVLPRWYLADEPDEDGDTVYFSKLVQVVAIEHQLHSLGLGPDSLMFGLGPEDPDAMRWSRKLRTSEIECIAQVFHDFGLPREIPDAS